jgi:hypothetical protein
MNQVHFGVLSNDGQAQIPKIIKYEKKQPQILGLLFLF